MKKTIKSRTKSKGVLMPQQGLAAKVALVEKSTPRAEMVEFAAGDTIRVQVRIKEGDKERVQAYEGVVIAKGNHGMHKAFTVRKISHGVGVERIFLETSPKVAKVEMVQKGRVRRAKLYYIRGLEGKAARIEKSIETQAAVAARQAAKAANKAAKAST
jgi:large subunit ribosomal protein L19